MVEASLAIDLYLSVEWPSASLADEAGGVVHVVAEGDSCGCDLLVAGFAGVFREAGDMGELIVEYFEFVLGDGSGADAADDAVFVVGVIVDASHLCDIDRFCAGFALEILRTFFVQ